MFLKVPRWFFNQQPGSRITRFFGVFFLLLLLFVTQMKGTLRDRGRERRQYQSKEKGESGGVGCLEPPRGGEAGELLDKTCFE